MTGDWYLCVWSPGLATAILGAVAPSPCSAAGSVAQCACVGWEVLRSCIQAAMCDDFSGAPSLAGPSGPWVPRGLWERTTHWRNHILLYFVGMGPGLPWILPSSLWEFFFLFKLFILYTWGRAS